MRYGILIACIALLLLAACGNSAANVGPNSMPQDEGTIIEPPVKLTDFTLPSSLDRDFSLSELKGKPTLIFFGYTFCPDVCPITLSELKRAKEGLGDQADQLQVVFISVDAERDTPEVLKKHLAVFDPSFIGLQGDESTLRQIGKDYGLFYQRREVEGTSAAYLMDHSSATYLIDGAGELRVIYSYGTAPDVITKGVQRLLSES